MTEFIYFGWTIPLNTHEVAIITIVTSSVPKARSVQLKAVVISERVLGFDHPNTIQQYVSFSPVCMTKIWAAQLEIKGMGMFYVCKV